MLQIVDEVRNKDSARRVFTILYDRFFTRTLYQTKEVGKANRQNTAIAPCCGHANAPILKNKLEYVDLCKGNGLNCQWATHNTALISRIVGINKKRIWKRVQRRLSDAEHAYHIEWRWKRTLK
jgi:hypothetical protein